MWGESKWLEIWGVRSMATQPCVAPGSLLPELRISCPCTGHRGRQPSGKPVQRADLAGNGTLYFDRLEVSLGCSAAQACCGLSCCRGPLPAGGPHSCSSPDPALGHGVRSQALVLSQQKTLCCLLSTSPPPV